MPDHEPACTGTKRCSRCGEEKAVLAFAVDKKATDGLQSECRDCRSVATSESPSRAKRREELQKAALKRWDMAHQGRPGRDW